MAFDHCRPVIWAQIIPPHISLIFDGSLLLTLSVTTLYCQITTTLTYHMPGYILYMLWLLTFYRVWKNLVFVQACLIE